MLKFSGDLAADVAGLTTISFLTDSGSRLAVAPTLVAEGYPVAAERALINMATNLSVVVPPGGQVLLELLLNGVALSSWTTIYGAGESGVKLLSVGPLSLTAGDRLDLRGTTQGFFGSTRVSNVSATFGVQ